MTGLVRCANPACSSLVNAARVQSTGGLCSICEKYGPNVLKVGGYSPTVPRQLSSSVMYFWLTLRPSGAISHQSITETTT